VRPHGLKELGLKPGVGSWANGTVNDSLHAIWGRYGAAVTALHIPFIRTYGARRGREPDSDSPTAVLLAVAHALTSAHTHNIRIVFPFYFPLEIL
jgi:hypothetical protein